MGETRELPFPEFPGESAVERTRRRLATHPELLNQVAYRHWIFVKGAVDTEVERNAWADLPPDTKEDWRNQAWRVCEEYWALSPDEQRLRDRASFALEMDRNAALDDMLRLERREPTP